MKVIEWKNRVRVGVGEFTRTQMLDFIEEAGRILDDNPTTLLRVFEDMTTARAVRTFEVRDGDAWVSITDTPTMYDQLDGASVALPLTPYMIGDLPASLARVLAEVCAEENDDFVRRLFLAPDAETSETKTSGSSSDDTPSTAQSQAQEQEPTKTTGA